MVVLGLRTSGASFRVYGWPWLPFGTIGWRRWLTRAGVKAVLLMEWKMPLGSSGVP